MIKYFCDRCGNELTAFDYDSAVQVTITDENNDIAIYHVCSNCEFAIKHFIKDGQFKAGDYK